MAWVQDRARAVAGTGVTDRLLDLATAAGVAVLVSVGFVTSYATLSSLAVHRGQFPQWLAPAVPLAFDVGIITMSLKVCRLAREGRSAVLLRLLIAALCVCTVVANAAAGVDWGAVSSMRFHPPCSWCVSSPWWSRCGATRCSGWV
jgi:hypothetical protein